MILSILIGLVLVLILAFLFGIGLAFASVFFAVKTDPKFDQILAVLPGANCGACGFPGCSGYADALSKKADLEINLCTPGGPDVVKKIGSILGRTGEAKLKMVAKVFCLGDDAIALKDYEFNGEEDCTAVSVLFDGERKCKYGCVGRGNCIRVCPVGAIKRDKYNRIWIDANECIGCEKCVAVCPKYVIKMVPINGGYFVACSSKDPGKIVKQICKKGCIGCKICEKQASPDRIKVDNNLAVVNYQSDIDLYQAALKCPADVIVPIVNQTDYMEDNKKNKSEKNLQ